MKKVEQVEVEYIKKTTTLLIAVACLVVGFALGLVYSRLLSNGDHDTVSTSEASQPVQQAQTQTQSPEMDTQKAAQIMQLKQMTDANPGDAQAWVALGHAYFDTSNYNGAIEAYNKYLALKPGDPNVLTDLGIMYRRSGKPRQAIESFDKAIKSDPSHEQSRFNKGVVLMFDLNMTDAAIQSWKELLEVNPAAVSPGGRPVNELIKQYSTSKK